MASPVGNAYQVAAGRGIACGRAPWAPAAGTIANISTNTRDDIDPRYDPSANPNYPAAPPWESGPSYWLGRAAYCGAVLADELGDCGTYMQYGGAGHATVNACFWVGFDLSDRTWKRIGNRPLPSDGLFGLIGTDTTTLHPATQIDPTWGDWQGNSTAWGAFAQGGWNPPEGGHTRNSFFVRPAAKAGNAHGQVVTCWQPTGANSGTNIKGSFVWDADTKLFSRTANLRPDWGSACGGVGYFESLDIAVACNYQSNADATSIDWLDCSTMTWGTRTTTANGARIGVDSTNIVHEQGSAKLWIVCRHFTSAPVTPPFDLYAIDAQKIKDGTAQSWTTLTVSAASWPIADDGFSGTVQWSRCPIDGCYYAVNRQHGSNKLWKLTPPAGTTAASQLSGTWTITEQTLTGTLDGRNSLGAGAAVHDYSRLRWSRWANAFLWTPNYTAGSVQAIRPQGV